MITAFDTMVNGMVAMDIPREKAERAARIKLGIAGSGADVVDLDDDALEDVHVAQGDKLMRALGFEVVCFSQKKRAKVTPGIPDRRYMRRPRVAGRATFPDDRVVEQLGPAVTLWMEWKASWGRQSDPQKNFQALTEACGEPYVVGGYAQLVEWLLAQRLAVRVGDILEPVREL
ncbi:MAG TPA: hypothetical protein VK636_15375 [Gemmatimonadaceae bacterium]|nr:hypothetical protein [Gemmatimonadaceae bacterium]